MPRRAAASAMLTLAVPTFGFPPYRGSIYSGSVLAAIPGLLLDGSSGRTTPTTTSSPTAGCCSVPVVRRTSD